MDLSSLKRFDEMMARGKQAPPSASSSASTSTSARQPVMVIDMSKIVAAATTSASSKEVTIQEYGLTLKFERNESETIVYVTHDGVTGHCRGKWHSEEEKVFGVKNIVARGMLGGFGTLIFGAFVYYCLNAPEAPEYFCLSTKNEAPKFWGKYKLSVEAPLQTSKLKQYSQPAAAVKAIVDGSQQVTLFERKKDD